MTDHSPNPKKLHTNDSSEDEEFYNYEQKLREFHTKSPRKTLNGHTEDFTHPATKLLNKDFELRYQKKDGGEDSEGDEESDQDSPSLVPQ